MEHLGSWSTVGALEKLHMWQNEALPITSSFVGPSPRDGLPMAVVAVDWRDRPDVADLGRVHRLEGPGNAQAGWTFVTEQDELWALLDVRLQRPIHCGLKLCFRVRERLAELTDAARSGLIGVALMSPDADGSPRGQVLVIEHQAADLRQVLDEWAVLNALGQTEKAP